MPPEKPYTKPGEEPVPPEKPYTKPGEEPVPPEKPSEKPKTNGKTGGCGDGSGAGKGVEQQLNDLKARLLDEQKSMLQFELAKAKAAALEAQIQSLADIIKTQKASHDAYRDFYNKTQVDVREAARFIEIVRCQLKLPNKPCVEAVIAEGRARVTEALAARDKQKQIVADAEQTYARAAFELEHAKRIHDLFKSGLQDHVKKQFADLMKLKGQADPTKDHCEAEFYLTEMEWHLRSAYCPPSNTSHECYAPDLRLGTFLDCWAPNCYCEALDRAIVEYNTAVLAEKDAKAALDREKATLKEREDTLKKLEEKRREWVISELKVRGCCKPKDAGSATV